MSTYKFVVTAERERFMEAPLKDVSEHYVQADSIEEAAKYVRDNLSRGGWKVISMKSSTVWVHDIRSSK